eukprot:snap_masked-scaffold_4-processed-gene-11.30-mRNA-1 protein AED:1.00 eAED:1.00 QI:0/0/0/0/1/1/2/0/148
MATIDDEEESPFQDNTFQVRPNEQEKAMAYRIQSVARSVLKEHLDSQQYDPEMVSSWIESISEQAKQMAKKEVCTRYKVMVQSFLGEKRGQGVRVASRSFWDKESDLTIHEHFSNVHISLFYTVGVSLCSSTDPCLLAPLDDTRTGTK